MKRFLTFGLLSVALFFAGCSNNDSIEKDFLTDSNVMPRTKPKPPALVTDPGLTDEQFQELDSLNYKMFGAGGEGETDDFDAIIKTHEVANTFNKKVKVNDGTYYIGGANKQAIIQTPTEWDGATFYIDDRNAVNLGKHVFRLFSRLPTRQISSITKIERHQPKLDLKLEYPSFVSVNNDTLLVYRRQGVNAHGGVPLNDLVVLDRDGNVREDTPFIFDFDYISSMTAYPIDEDTLYVTGGKFYTYGTASALYIFAGRGIHVTRSNVVVSGIDHDMVSDQRPGTTPSPYRGFIVVELCTDVLLKDLMLTGRYNGGTSVGTYDVSVLYASNAYFKHCRQRNESSDQNTRWGIFSSNNTKNLTFDDVWWSRFDAHRGVYNVDIINGSNIGPQGARSLGEGTLRIKDSRIRSSNVISMREDYGCSWQGEMIIQDVIWEGSGSIIAIGSFIPDFNYGMPLYFAEKIWIDGLSMTGNRNLAPTQTNGYDAGPGRPGGFNIRPKYLYERNVTGGTLNWQTNTNGALAYGATIVRPGDSLWEEPPPYKNPAVKYLPYDEDSGGKPVYGYRGDYGDWENFPDPNPGLYPKWGN